MGGVVKWGGGCGGSTEESMKDGSSELLSKYVSRWGPTFAVTNITGSLYRHIQDPFALLLARVSGYQLLCAASLTTTIISSTIHRPRKHCTVSLERRKVTYIHLMLTVNRFDNNTSLPCNKHTFLS